MVAKPPILPYLTFQKGTFRLQSLVCRLSPRLLAEVVRHSSLHLHQVVAQFCSSTSVRLIENRLRLRRVVPHLRHLLHSRPELFERLQRLTGGTDDIGCLIGFGISFPALEMRPEELFHLLEIWEDFVYPRFAVCEFCECRDLAAEIFEVKMNGIYTPGLERACQPFQSDLLRCGWPSGHVDGVGWGVDAK